MVQNGRLLREFEERFEKRHRLSHAEALRILDGLWAEARALGVVPSKDRLAGIDVDIRVARILDSCSKPSSPD